MHLIWLLLSLSFKVFLVLNVAADSVHIYGRPWPFHFTATGLRIRITLMRIRIRPFHFDADLDPDPASHQSNANLRALAGLWYGPSKAPFWRVSTTPFWGYTAPEFWLWCGFRSNLHSDEDSDPASQNNADSDPQYRSTVVLLHSNKNRRGHRCNYSLLHRTYETSPDFSKSASLEPGFRLGVLEQLRHIHCVPI